MLPVTADNLIWTLLQTWQVVLFVIMLIFQAGANVYMVRDMKAQIVTLHRKNEAVEADIRRRLYDERSQPIYVTAAFCLSCRMDCIHAREKVQKSNDDQWTKWDQKMDLLLERTSKFSQYIDSHEKRHEYEKVGG